MAWNWQQKASKDRSKDKEGILKQRVVHFDETGCHSQGKR